MIRAALALVAALSGPADAPAMTAGASAMPAAAGIAAGIASWYSDGPGLYAAVPGFVRAAGTYQLRVCTPTACVTLTVRDWCQCYVGTSRERIIDLSPEAFRQLAPLSRGLVAVTVERP